MTRSVPHIPAFDPPLKGWQVPPIPIGIALKGRFVELEALSSDAHAEALFQAYVGHDQVWDYLPYGPFDSMEAYRDWVADIIRDPSLCFYAIRNLETGAWEGVASFLRINPAAGSIEVGHINFSPALQRTRAATEAMYLMMQWAFDAGYRRYEWKCDAQNLGSRRAAQRLGFSYEGVFRQATVVKGRNRDTAWFAAIDNEWPTLNAAFKSWLQLDNFKEGRQVKSLGDLTGTIRVSADPAF